MYINARHIKSVVGLAAKESTRYAINGVLLEPILGGTRYVATDGRSLAICDSRQPAVNEISRRYGKPWQPEVERPLWTLTEPLLLQAAPLAKFVNVVLSRPNTRSIAYLTMSLDGKQVTGIYAGANWKQVEVPLPIEDGHFPRYADVIPSTEDMQGPGDKVVNWWNPGCTTGSVINAWYIFRGDTEHSRKDMESRAYIPSTVGKPAIFYATCNDGRWLGLSMPAYDSGAGLGRWDSKAYNNWKGWR